MNKILVLGSGAWATALSQVLLTNKNNEVSIYGINQDELNDLSHQKNTKFFPNLSLPYAYYAIYNNLDILQTKKFDYLLLAVPSCAIESLLNDMSKKIDEINNVDTGIYQGNKRPAELKAELDDFRKLFDRVYGQVLKSADDITAIANTMDQE